MGTPALKKPVSARHLGKTPLIEMGMLVLNSLSH
jgi:hypothetical protein